MKNNNIFSIFYYQATSNEKKMIISLCLLFAFSSSGIIGIPIWFEEPKFLCQDSKTLKFHHCSEFEMCSYSNSSSYMIDWEVSASTLATELNLFCDRKYIKRVILTVIFLGGFLGCLTNFLIVVKPERRKMIFSLLGILFAFANFIIIFFSSSEMTVSIALGTIAFTCMIGNSYGIIIINEYFSGDLAKAATIFMTLFCGVFGICFGFYAYVIHSNWKLLFLTMGILVLLDSLYLLCFRSEKGIKETLSKAPSNVLDFLKDLSSDPKIRTNYLCYLFVWTTYSVTYNDILLELSTVGGNFYVNMMMLSAVEIFASFAASVISLKFSISNSLKKITVILVICFGGFFLSPAEEDQNSFYVIFLLFCMLLGKFFSQIVCNLIYVYAPKILTDIFTPFFLIGSRLSSRIFLLFLPHINYFVKQISLHAFTFLAVIWAISRLLQNFAEEVQSEGIEDILNEYEIDVMSRVSIMTGASMMHHSPDELLKNIEVEGGNLSLVRKSRYYAQNESPTGLSRPFLSHKLKRNKTFQ